jgi:hypothetical protein
MATAQHMTSDSAKRVPASRSAATRSKHPKGGVGGLLLGPLCLLLGLWLESHFGPTNAICSTGLGAFGQAVSSTAAHDCTLASAATTFGELFVWVGGLITVVGVLGVIIVVAEALQDGPTTGAKRSTSQATPESRETQMPRSSTSLARDRSAAQGVCGSELRPVGRGGKNGG